MSQKRNFYESEREIANGHVITVCKQKTKVNDAQKLKHPLESKLCTGVSNWNVFPYNYKPSLVK